MYKLLYYLLIVLTIYIDSPLQESMGAFGLSLLSPLSIVLYLCFFPVVKKQSDKFISTFNTLLLYTILISILSFVVLYAMGYSLTIREEFLPVKSIKVLLYFVSATCYLKLLLLFTRGMTVNQILRPFLFTFILISGILFIEFLSPEMLERIHYIERPNNRIRLLAGEASWTASMIEIFFAISLYYVWFYKKSHFLSFVVVAMFVMHILLSTSKTLLVASFIAIVYIIIQRFKQTRRSTMIWSLVFLIPVFLFLCLFLLPQIELLFINDIERNASTVTRGITSVSAVIIGIIYPIGTGFSAYLTLMPDMIGRLLSYVDVYNTEELLMFLQSSSDAALSAKSFLTQNTMYWGIIGTVIFLRAFFRLYHRCFDIINLKGDWFLKCIFWIVLIQICLSSNLQYDILAFIFIMIFISKRAREIKKRSNLLQVIAHLHNITEIDYQASHHVYSSGQNQVRQDQGCASELLSAVISVNPRFHKLISRMMNNHLLAKL